MSAEKGRGREATRTISRPLLPEEVEATNSSANKKSAPAVAVVEDDCGIPASPGLVVASVPSSLGLEMVRVSKSESVATFANDFSKMGMDGEGEEGESDAISSMPNP